jgi:hypothetical protein
MFGGRLTLKLNFPTVSQHTLSEPMQTSPHPREYRLGCTRSASALRTSLSNGRFELRGPRPPVVEPSLPLGTARTSETEFGSENMFFSRSTIHFIRAHSSNLTANGTRLDARCASTLCADPFSSGPSHYYHLTSFLVLHSYWLVQNEKLG